MTLRLVWELQPHRYRRMLKIVRLLLQAPETVGWHQIGIVRLWLPSMSILANRLDAILGFRLVAPGLWVSPRSALPLQRPTI